MIGRRQNRVQNFEVIICKGGDWQRKAIEEGRDF